MPIEDSEKWHLTYYERPDVYEDFSRYHDPERKVTRRLLERASFKGKMVLEIGCGSGGFTRQFGSHAGRCKEQVRAAVKHRVDSLRCRASSSSR